MSAPKTSVTVTEDAVQQGGAALPEAGTPERQVMVARFVLVAELLGYPDAEFAERLSSGELAVRAEGLFPEVEGTGLRSYAGRPASEFLQQLRVEHTRLFIGTPYPLCTPYESQQRARERGEEATRFIDRVAMQVSADYRACGLRLSDDNGEPPDHVMTECEFMAYTLNLGTEQGNKAFMSFWAQHACRWFYLLARDIREAANEPLFSCLPAMLESLAPEDEEWSVKMRKVAWEREGEVALHSEQKTSLEQRIAAPGGFGILKN